MQVFNIAQLKGIGNLQCSMLDKPAHAALQLVLVVDNDVYKLSLFQQYCLILTSFLRSSVIFFPLRWTCQKNMNIINKVSRNENKNKQSLNLIIVVMLSFSNNVVIVNQINKKMSCGAPPYFSRWITKKMGLSYVIKKVYDSGRGESHEGFLTVSRKGKVSSENMVLSISNFIWSNVNVAILLTFCGIYLNLELFFSRYVSRNLKGESNEPYTILHPFHFHVFCGFKKMKWLTFLSSSVLSLTLFFVPRKGWIGSGHMDRYI